MNLLQRIQKISEEVKIIEKDMTVGKGNYAYKAVSDNQVTLRVKEAEIKHGVVSIPIKQELVSSETIKTIKDNKESFTYVDNIKMTVRFYNVDDIKEFIDIESFGKGVDPSDKGFGKASTYARKYALLNAYKIATGEDPDANKSETIQSLTVNEKLVSIKNVTDKDSNLSNEICSHFNVGSIDDLSQKDINTVYDNFTKKGRING